MLMRSYFLCNNLLKSFLNGSLIIRWKLIKTSVIYLIVSTIELTEIQIGGFLTKNNANEKWLGVNIDSKLNFDCHINHLCNKANTKLSAFARVTPCMTLEKRKLSWTHFSSLQSQK